MRASAWHRIKSKPPSLVKPAAALGMLLAVCSPRAARAQDDLAPPPISTETPSATDATPEIAPDSGGGATDIPDSGGGGGGGGGPDFGPADSSGGGNHSSGSDDDEEGAESIAVEEVKEMDPWSEWLSVEFGYFRNTGVNGSASSYFAGGGLRYGLTLLSRFFADSNRAQDAIVIEGGAFYYRVVNFLAAGDSYQLVPLIGTLRYDLNFSENFCIFFYAGFMDNLVVASSGTNSATGAQGLALQTPAAGAGFFYRVGPNWDMRVDLGTDVFQLGLVLKF